MKIGSPKLIPAGLLVGLVCMVAVGQVIKKGDGDLNRAVLTSNPLLTAGTDWVYPRNLHAVQLREGDAQKAYVVDPSRPIEILFMGDSHVEQYSARVKAQSLATGKNAGFITSGGCLTVPGVHGVEGAFKHCAKSIAMIEKTLEDDRIKRVVIGNIWGNYKHQPTGLVFETPEGEVRPLDNGGFESALSILSSMIKAHPEKEFFILLDYPWNEGAYDRRNHIWAQGSFNPHRAGNRWKTETVEHLFVGYPELSYWEEGNVIVQKMLAGQARFIETASLVCPNRRCDLMNYKDDDHLRSSYIEKHATWIDQVFE